MLAAAVALVLAVPREFLNASLMMPSLELAFRMGLSFESIARLGLDALEHWMYVAADKIVPHLHEVLPLLGDYLTSETKASKEGVLDSAGPSDETTEEATAIKFHFKIKGAKSIQKASISRKTVSLDIQHRILGLLGMMGGLNEALLSGTTFDIDQSMAWDTVRRIKFKLPLTDLMPTIYFDEILPRIGFLAESSPDRRTKVAACELLHTLILYMIGLNSSDPSKDKGGEKAAGTNFSKIYGHVFPAMLRLATDLDVVPKQLFYTLAFQCINWFTGNKTPESPETMALLNAIVGAVGDEHSSGLRVFGARCVGEFFRCSQRRNSASEPAAAAAHNFKSLLKRVFSLAHQPSPFARLGAAMAFGQIYREFRSSVRLVREHVMDMLYEMLQSLRVAHKDPESVGTADRASVVVRQLARVACKYGYKLLHSTGCASSRFKSIDAFVDYLSGEIAARETKYRKECMALLADFVKLLPNGKDSPQKWLASKSSTFLRTMTEGNLLKYMDSASASRLWSPDGLSGVLSFFECLAASLESLGWLLRRSFIADIKLVLASDDKTSVFRGMKKLLTEFDGNLDALRSLTPFEQSQYRQLCGCALLRVFRFMLLLAEKESVWFNKSPLVQGVFSSTPQFYKRLFDSLLDPTTASAGVDDMYKSFPIYTAALLKLLAPNAKMKAILAECVNERNVFAFDPADSATNLQTVSNLVAGYRQMVPLVQDSLRRDAKKFVLEKSTVYRSEGRALTPGQIQVAVDMMALSLELEAVTPKDVLAMLLRSEPPSGGSTSPTSSPRNSPRRLAEGGGCSQGRPTLGSVWYEFFHDPVDRFLLEHWEVMGGPIVTQMKTSPVMMAVVFSLLKKCGARARPAVARAMSMCKYGALCHRTSLSHRSKHFHPVTGGDLGSDDASQQMREHQAVRSVVQEQEHWTEKFKPAFLDQVCNHLEELAGWAREEADLKAKESLLNLVHELLKLDPHRVLEPKSRSRTFCTVVAVKFLGRTLPKSFKNRSMSSVAPLLKFLPEGEVAGILEALRAVVVYDFPLRSTDLVENGPAYNDYVQSIEIMMGLLRESGNLRILEILYPVLGEANHRHRERIYQLLAQFVQHLEADKAMEAFRLCYAALMDPLHQHMLQYVLVTRVCLPILLKSEPDVVQDLFLEYVARLVESIPTEANLTSARRSEDPGPAKRHQPGDVGVVVSLDHNVVVQICSFDLLREFYKLIPRDNIHGIVNQAYISSLGQIDAKKKVNGNELTIRVSSAAYSAKVTVPHKTVRESVPPTLVRQYHQSAFNCLAAVVICTQHKEDLYSSLILEEKSKKGEVFWNNIIETDVEWRFEVDTNYLVVRKAMSEVRPENDLVVGASGELDPAARRTLLVERFLGTSSLDTSEGGGFWNSSQKSESSSLGSDVIELAQSLEGDRRSPKGGKSRAGARGVPQNVEEYEFDIVNANPCMPTILYAIDVLFDKFKYNNFAAMPTWMHNLVKVMENTSLHANIRLFVGKIFVNRQATFKPWGQRFLLGPLLRLCMTAENMAMIRGQDEKGITYYLRDICIVMLKFGKPTPDLRSLASQFISWLIKKIPTKNTTVLRENVRLFGFFYTQWDGCFDLEKKLIVAMLKQVHDTYGPMLRSVGLQLTALIMEKGRLPVEQEDMRLDPQLDEMEFYRQLLANLEHKASRIYLAAAEVSGELLALLSLRGSDSYLAFKRGLADCILAMFARKDLDRAISCLQLISEKSPDFADQFFSKLFDVLGVVTGKFKSSILEVLEKRTAVLGRDLPQQMRPHIVPLLENREPRTQLLALLLTKSMIKTMDDALLNTLLRPLSAFSSHSSVECRRVAYQIFIDIWDHRESFHSNVIVRVTLLRGLSDPEEKQQQLPGIKYSEEDEERIRSHKPISELMQEFWNHPRRLSDATVQRLEELLSTAYEPEIESEWLSFAPAMLLQLSTKGQTYRQKLFDYPLEQGAQFVEVKIATHSATLGGGGGRRGGGGTDGTLPYTSSRTIMGSQDGEYVSMDQFVSSARVDGHKQFMSEAFGDIVWTPSQSMADPAVVPKKKTVTSAFKMVDLPGQPQVEVAEVEGHLGTALDEQNSVYRRFRKPTESMSSSFDMSTYLKRKQQFGVERRVRENLMSGLVPLSRTYLMGELPNIGITPEEFIAPLVTIASRDKSLSSTLLALIVDGTIASVPSGSRESILDTLRQLIGDCLARTAHHGAFVSCLLRICNSHAGLAIDDALVGSCALKASSYHGGALVLEKQIEARKAVVKQGAGKRRKKEDTHLERNKATDAGWKPLAVLYKVLGDDDVLMGISDRHLAQHSYTHDAICKELEGDFEGALAVYEQGASAAGDPKHDWNGNPPMQDELDLWEDGRLECLANLTRWKDLADSAKAEVDSDTSLLWRPEFETYLSVYMQGSFRTPSEWKQWNQFVDDSLTDEEHSKWLVKHFGPQLAMLSIVRDDYDRAQSFIGQSSALVLETWRSLHPLARKGRLRLLQSLQLLKEMQEVVEFTRNDKNFNTMKPLEGLLRRWNTRWPQDMTSIVVWDTVAYSRELLLEKLQQRFVYRQKVGAQGQQYGMQWDSSYASRENVELAIAEARVGFWRRCTAASIRQRNLAVASAFNVLTTEAEATRAAVSMEAGAVGLANLPSLRMMVKLFEKQSHRAASIEENVTLICDGIVTFRDKKGFSDDLLVSVPHSFLMYHRTSAKLFTALHDCVRQAGQKELPNVVKIAVDKKVLNAKPEGASSHVRDCLKQAYFHLNYAYKSAEKDTDKRYVAKTFMHMARFCDRVMADRKDRNAEGMANYAKHVIEPILAATALNLREASDMLPKVLILLAEYPRDEVVAKFDAGVAACPSWMFIRWVSYLLANLSNDFMAQRVLPILTKLATDYPMAIYYPFHLSANPKFLSKESSRQLVEPLRKLLKAPKLEELMFHLMLLQHPEHRFADWLQELRRLRKRKDVAGVKEDWKRFYDLTLDTQNQYYGNYNAKWASAYRAKIVGAVGDDDGRNLASMSEEPLLKLSQKAREEIPNKNSTRQEELSNYSRWLADFDYLNLPTEDRIWFEVPGQYDNLFGKPDPESHVRISSFGDKILSMGSLRKPKKVVMVGTDQKMYPWLVKGGEDLRQDQRIEQLWDLMNDLLLKSTSTNARGLRLETYKVVPMSLQLGLVEWVEGTTPLKGIIEDQIKSDGLQYRGVQELPANTEHHKWLEKFVPKDASKRNDPHACYYEMLTTASRENVLAKWERQMEQVDHTLLRRGISAIARSPESYLCLRNGFARSLACVSASGYVAGIGDRHLDNFLVNLKNGFIVPIDFGHAFGTATFQLQIPEIMPFRLTPQLVNFLEPIGPYGMLVHNMTHVLSCFAKNKERLLNLMEVFIKEPHMEWIKLAEKSVAQKGSGISGAHSNNSGSGSSAGAAAGGGAGGVLVNTFAERRMKLVRDKLEQRNPTIITCDELDESTQKTVRPALVEKMKEHARGNRDHNIRAHVGERCASVTEQVEALVDMATDPNILGRVWAGWTSFC